LLLLSSRTLALVLGGLYLAAQQTVLAFALVGALMNVVVILIVGRAVKAWDNAQVVTLACPSGTTGAGSGYD